MSKIALLIGNGTYNDESFRPLVRPRADADALDRVLKEQNIGAFDEVTRLIDVDSLTARKAIASLFKNRVSDDVLLFFYAGHGVKDEFGELHLAMHDTASDELSATGIPAGFIAREMDRSRSRNQILILDCCFSGAFGDARGAEAGSVGARESFHGNGTGRVILTASDAFEYAWERDQAVSGPNSVFTSFLVKGLETGDADRDHDGVVTVEEWYDYVYDEMARSKQRQTPQRTVAGAGRIVIAASPLPAVELEPELVASMRSSYPHLREGAVRELARLLQGDDRALAAAASEHLRRLTGDVDARVRRAASDALSGVLTESGQRPIVAPEPPRPQPQPQPPPQTAPRPAPAPPPPLQLPVQPAWPVPQYAPAPSRQKSPLRLGCGILLILGSLFFGLASLGGLSEPDPSAAVGVGFLSLVGLVVGIVVVAKR